MKNVKRKVKKLAAGPYAGVWQPAFHFHMLFAFLCFSLPYYEIITITAEEIVQELGEELSEELSEELVKSLDRI